MKLLVLAVLCSVFIQQETHGKALLSPCSKRAIQARQNATEDKDLQDFLNLVTETGNTEVKPETTTPHLFLSNTNGEAEFTPIQVELSASEKIDTNSNVFGNLPSTPTVDVSPSVGSDIPQVQIDLKPGEEIVLNSNLFGNSPSTPIVDQQTEVDQTQLIIGLTPDEKTDSNTHFNEQIDRHSSTTEAEPPKTEVDITANEQIDSNSNLFGNSPSTPKIDLDISTQVISDININEQAASPTTVQPEIEITASSTQAAEITTEAAIKTETTTEKKEIHHHEHHDHDYHDQHIFNAHEDAEALHHAQKGHSLDKSVVIQILTHRTHTQRLQIVEEYQLLYKSYLVNDLECKLSGWLRELVIALLSPQVEFYAKELYIAMDGPGTDEVTMVDILTTSSNREIEHIREAFHQIYDMDLITRIKDDTSGDFLQLMVALAHGSRDESGIVNEELAAEDAKRLLQAGELKLGTDEETFIEILTKRNFKQLKHAFDKYEHITGHKFEHAIESEFSSHIRRGLLSVTTAARSVPHFYAGRLFDSMIGQKSLYRHIIRIIVTRRDIDLDMIKVYYKLTYGVTIKQAIEYELKHDDFQEALLNLVGE